MHKARHQQKGNEGRLLSPGAAHATSTKEKRVGLVPKVACYLSFFMFSLSACAFITLHYHQAAENAQLQQRMPRLSARRELGSAAIAAPSKPVEKSLPEMTQPSEDGSEDILLLPKAQELTQSEDSSKEQEATEESVPVAKDTMATKESHAVAGKPAARIARSPRRANKKVDFVLNEDFAGYALIPRPKLIKPLPHADSSTTGVSDVSGPIIRFDAESRQIDDRIEAMLAAYQELLGLHVQRADLSKESNVQIGSVVVVLRATVKAACAACAQLVGRNPEDENLQPLEDAKESEWHFAIFSERRLVVCAVDAEGGFRFASTLRQMLYAIPRSIKVNSIVTSETKTTSMVTSQTTPSGSFQTTSGAFDSSETATTTTSTLTSQTIASNKTSDSTPKEGYRRLLELDPFVLQDWPHFEWRGLQLDCVRHFMPMPFLKRYLRAMAYYKANIFHWHLTDDQAWRVFIPKRPKLVNASATPGFYSTDDVHTIVKFAAGLFIKIIPVIETPGHSLVSLAAYPELACEGTDFKAPLSRVGTYDDILCVAKRDTENFARDVFDEIARLFPFKFVHIGGDEIPTVKWQRSKHVKAFAGLLGLKNLQADILEAWYCFLSSLLKEHGRKIVMWDDHFVNRQWGVSKLCPGAEEDWVVQAWRMDPPVGDLEKESIVASFKFRSISSSMKRCYLDYPVASIDFNKTLSWRPGEGGVMGGCANMWTEDSEPEEVGSKVYPRYLGLSDRMWDGVTPDRKRDLDLPMYAAAQMHCNSDGPLLKEFNFSCGRFEIVSAGRSEFWKHTSFSSSVDAFDKSFNFDRALDEDPDTYFWGISPKRFDTMDVYWRSEDRSHGAVVGKCLTRATVATGSKDRPGDQLDNGDLMAAQWLREGDSWKLDWVKLAAFVGGKAEADQQLLSQGPIVGLRIKVTVEQTKWITIPEIDVVECEASDHLPRVEELPETSPQSLFGSGGWGRENYAFGKIPQSSPSAIHKPGSHGAHHGHGHSQHGHHGGKPRAPHPGKHTTR